MPSRPRYSYAEELAPPRIVAGVEPKRIDRRPAPSIRPDHKENRLIDRIGRLRAAVLGADEGLVSTASLPAGIGHLVGRVF